MSNSKDGNITKDCRNWLKPISDDSLDTSYEKSAIDAVLGHIARLEDANTELRKDLQAATNSVETLCDGIIHHTNSSKQAKNSCKEMLEMIPTIRLRHGLKKD